MRLSNFSNKRYKSYLSQLPKIAQSASSFITLYNVTEFREVLFNMIDKAKRRICIVSLYLENDEIGHKILSLLYSTKKIHPKLDIYILVDWHRAQRKRIGSDQIITNAEWYRSISREHPNIVIPIYGVPVNITEALGVLHLKGLIIDDTVIYTGANINNFYFYECDSYRLDRYQVITNQILSDSMDNWINQHIIKSKAVYRLDDYDIKFSNINKKETRFLRQELRNNKYHYEPNADNNQLSVIPLIGLGSNSILNKTIQHLFLSVLDNIIICTPYFNLPKILINKIVNLLDQGKKVEIIVSDKTANDFYISPDRPFRIVNVLPYLYEINLRYFLKRLKRFLSSKKLIVRLWKNGTNSFHCKGIWIDDTWIMITGNNLNMRAKILDLENAILIHDPCKQLNNQLVKELTIIRDCTVTLSDFRDLESIADYPLMLRNLINQLQYIKLDKLIRYII